MAFWEVEFLRGIGFRSSGGPGFSTTVNEGFGGGEQRNQNWQYARAEYLIGLKSLPASQYSASQQSQIDNIRAFHFNAAGRANAFRFWDATDNSFAGQQIGVGNGTQAVFQLIKSYTIGGRTYTRNITKLVWSTISDYFGNALANSLTLALNSAPTSAWTVDPTTGLVTFSSAPGAGVVITAPTGNFHYPVRFDIDKLPIVVDESNVGGGKPNFSLAPFKLIEVLPPNY